MNIIDWYLKVIRDNYANFSGRARRSEYWYFTLSNILIIMFLALLTLIADALSFLMIIYAIAIIIPSMAVAVRRLHDTGKSGWLLLLSLVPFGSLILLVFYCIEGNNGPNQYGHDPKNPYNEFDDIGAKETY